MSSSGEELRGAPHQATASIELLIEQSAVMAVKAGENLADLTECGCSLLDRVVTRSRVRGGLAETMRAYDGANELPEGCHQ